MADIYLAKDITFDEHVTLKILLSEFTEKAKFVEHFRRHSKAAADLDHPNIIRIYDWGQERDTYYMAMEYVDGRSISDVLKSTGPIHANRATEIAMDVASALDVAHNAGLIHGDVRPSNIIIDDNGGVKISDFGVTASLQESKDEPDFLGRINDISTVTYFSPEHAQGKPLDKRSDMYSLGVTLYEMIVGKPPFSAETATALAAKHITERPISPRRRGADIAESLDAIILKLLSKKSFPSLS